MRRLHATTQSLIGQRVTSIDWSICDHSNRSWTNVARPCLFLRTNPASEKLGIASLSAIVQWVSCKTMMKTLFLSVGYLVRLTLFALSSALVSCRMLGLRSTSAAATLMCLEKGVPSPRRTHPARKTVVVLVVTAFGWHFKNSVTGRVTKRHLSSSAGYSMTSVKKETRGKKYFLFGSHNCALYWYA